MGADFVTYTPNGDEARMAYTTVHRIRGYLARLAGEEFSNKYIKVFADLRIANTRNDPFEISKADVAFNELMLGLEGKYAYGIRAFLDHSDCDGVFYTEDCGAIAKVLDALLETDIVLSEDDRSIIDDLITAFESAYDHDGIVIIY